jgi:hypothetical protein
MPRNLVTPLFGLCLFAAASAPAHELVPASWCHGGSRQVVLEVHFTPDDLEQYRNTRVPVNLVTGEPCPQTAKCGIVDDWHWATQMMNDPLLSGAQLRTTASAASAVIAHVVTPSYRTAAHHQLYRFRDGLHVQYLECRFPLNSGN